MSHQYSASESPQQPEVPPFVKFTKFITNNPDPEKTVRNADMLLIFLAAGGTVLGSLFGAIIYFATAKPQTPTFAWLATLLVAVAIGGSCGCAAVMAVLHFKQMITWENRRNQIPKGRS